MKTLTSAAEIRLLKKMGNSDSTIANVTGLTLGAVQRATASTAVHVMRHVRKDQSQGHFRLNPFGESIQAKTAVKKLGKSSVPADEPDVILEAREMLSLGIDPDAICRQLGITREFMHKHLKAHWNV
jgi:DNA invertase Pin-like site-specific DNA recombinase